VNQDFDEQGEAFDEEAISIEVNGAEIEVDQVLDAATDAVRPIAYAPGTAKGAPAANPPRFPAFSHRNFRLFWTGNILSLIGTLAQEAARGWLVRSLTPDPFLLTLVAACGTFPILLLTLYAGAIADRVHKARGLIVTNAVSMALAFLLWGLTAAGHIQIWGVAAIALGVGVVNSFDITMRQSMNVEMVGHDDLPNAIALNSTAFNGARVLGPAIGGALIAGLGIAGCFLANAFSFVPLIWALGKMKLPPVERQKRRAGLAEIAEGFDWIRVHPILAPTTLLIAVCSFAAFSFGNLLPIFAKDVFRTNASGFTLMLTSSGVGALFAAGLLAATGEMRHKGRRLLGGALAFCGCVVGFALSPSLALACAFLAVSGFCLLTCLMTANTLVQVAAPNNLSGRVFSFYSLALVGVAPLGALWIGALAKWFGPREAVAMSAGLAMAWTLGTILKCRAVWREP